MSYSPVTDLIALLRQTSGGVRTVRMPGLDYLVAGLARAGMFEVHVGQDAPTVNLAGTVWVKPAQPSWGVEAAIFLYDGIAGVFEPATPALWASLLTSYPGTVFQSITIGAAVIGTASTLVAIQRANPATTVLTLPPIALRGPRPLQIVDWSTGIAAHAITLTPAAGNTIMRLGAFGLLSGPDQLAGVTLYPSTNLNGWVIAP